MRTKPSVGIALGVYVGYLIIVIGAMIFGGADYLNLVGEEVIFPSVVLPLFLGAIFLLGMITLLGWWRPVMRESEPGRPKWLMYPLIVAALSFVAIGIGATQWTNLTTMQLIWLVIGSVLVGFNEEALTRGVVLLGFREGGRSETWVLFMSSLFFGLLHLPNALIGLPLYAALVQVVIAGFMGAGFYVIRRVGGTLLIPMVIHGLWDFSTFASGASGAEIPEIRLLLQYGIYGLAILSAAILIWKMRGHKTGNAVQET